MWRSALSESGGDVRALTVLQPWAWAIAHAGKLVENRTWAPPAYELCKPIAIHAGKRIDIESLNGFRESFRDEYKRFAESEMVATREAIDAVHDRLAGQRRLFDPTAGAGGLVLGAVVAVATLLASVRRADDPLLTKAHRKWFVGPVGWVFRDVRTLSAPLYCRGAQGLWTLDPKDEVEVRRRAGLDGERCR